MCVGVCMVCVWGYVYGLCVQIMCDGYACVYLSNRLHIENSLLSLSHSTMTLVYHGTPRLYPEHASSSSSGLCSSIAVIRFPAPVRLQSLRVVPQGVAHPTGVGCVQSRIPLTTGKRTPPSSPRRSS